MPTYNDCGIVLNSYNLGEADKILNLYTRGSGLVRAIGKGLRKSTSKFGGKIDQLSCCLFQFVKGKNLEIISDCAQVNSFPGLRTTLARLTVGILFLEIVRRFAEEKESESIHVYELLYSALEELQHTDNIFLHSIHFTLEFLSIHGLSPQLKTCVSCSAEVGWLNGSVVKELDSCPYSSPLGGLLCTDCAKLIDHKLINSNVLRIIRQEASFSDCNQDLHKALNLLRDHIDARAKNKIKSFDLVFSL